MNMETIDGGANRQTKISKLSTTFSIESLISTRNDRPQKNKNKLDNLMEINVGSEQHTQPTNRAMATVNNTNFGFGGFPLYNPWLQGYFSQNQERISQLFSVNGSYLSSSLLANAVRNTEPSVLPKPPASCESSNNSTFERHLPLPPLHNLDAQLPGSFFFKPTLPTDPPFRDLARFGPSTDYPHNLSLNARTSEDTSLSNGEDTRSRALETPLDVGGIEDDFECSGDSCSDISLTMSPQNYSTHLDKNRGKFNQPLTPVIERKS